jgi:hypothetical protein
VGFLNPGLLGLLGLGAVPVVIHLLNRRRHQVVPWPAMAFLLKAQLKTRQRLRMENLLLLLARTLAVLLFALAASRPFLPSAQALAAMGPDRRHLYILVDNSASMGYQEGISTLLQRAVREAKRAVDNSIRPGDPVTLVVACDEKRRGKPHWVLRGVRDHGKVNDALDRVRLTEARMDPAAALSEVAAVADAGDPRRTLLVLSDFQQADWSPVEDDGARGREGGKGAALAIRAQLDRLEQLRFELPGAFRFIGSPDPEDCAVLALGPADGRAPAEGRPVSFEVVVGNNGPAPVNAEVRFRVDERDVGSQHVSLRGRPSRSPMPETARVSFHWTGTAGPHFAEAVVEGPGDRLAANNDRGHAFTVRERIRAVLVDGDPAPPEPEGRLPETRLLEAALSLKRGVAPMETRVVPDADLARETFAGADVVVLANVRQVPDAAWDRLASFVRRGGGLMVFLGDRVDAPLWNSALERPSTADLLPARLAAAPRVNAGESVPLDLTASRHPVLLDLTDPRSGTSFDPPLVSGWFPLQSPLPEGSEVLLRLHDLPRSPFLVERHCGRGRVLLCTSSADLDWCGFSLLYAPLVQEAVTYLASAGSERRDLTVGETLVADVPETARDVKVLVPDSAGRSKGRTAHPIEPFARKDAKGPGDRVAEFPETGFRGRYDIQWSVPGPDGSLRETTIPFFVNLDPREADIARMRPEVLEERFQKRGLGAEGDGSGAAKAREKEAARGDLTGTALALGLAMVLAEMFLAGLFGRKRR